MTWPVRSGAPCSVLQSYMPFETTCSCRARVCRALGERRALQPIRSHGRTGPGQGEGGLPCTEPTGRGGGGMGPGKLPLRLRDMLQSPTRGCMGTRMAAARRLGLWLRRDHWPSAILCPAARLPGGQISGPGPSPWPWWEHPCGWRFRGGGGAPPLPPPNPWLGVPDPNSRLGLRPPLWALASEDLAVLALGRLFSGT